MTSSQRSSVRVAQRGQSAPSGGEGPMHTLRDFWTKLNNDWVFYLASLLAYNVVFSLIPLVLVVLAATGLVLDAGNADALAEFIRRELPGGVGDQVVPVVVSTLRDNVGPVLSIGVLTAIFFGSRLFIVIENCFGIIYRLPTRRFLAQNVTAIVMLLLYMVLVPVAFLAATSTQALAPVIVPGIGGMGELTLRLIGIAIAFVVAVVLFAAIYIIVPNERLGLRHAWKGTLVAAALLVLFQQVFPLYQSLFLQSGNYGSILGLAAVIIIFFYYLAFILLLGAEVNSWSEGQRPTLQDIPTLLYDVLRLHRIPTGTEPEAQSAADSRGGGSR